MHFLPDAASTNQVVYLRHGTRMKRIRHWVNSYLDMNPANHARKTTYFEGLRCLLHSSDFRRQVHIYLQGTETWSLKGVRSKELSFQVELS